ncbi:MAG: PDZ domain-containing protein [Planctomycetota bacterium]
MKFTWLAAALIAAGGISGVRAEEAGGPAEPGTGRPGRGKIEKPMAPIAPIGENAGGERDPNAPPPPERPGRFNRGRDGQRGPGGVDFGGENWFGPREVKTEKAAYLGISASPVRVDMREQLKEYLPKGIGLVVGLVEKGSPAEAAGFKQYDILKMLGDQLLVNPQQLQVLVRLQKTGEPVEFIVIREGKPVTVKATLVEKDLPVLDDRGFGDGIDRMIRRPMPAPASPDGLEPGSAPGGGPAGRRGQGPEGAFQAMKFQSDGEGGWYGEVRGRTFYSDKECRMEIYRNEEGKKCLRARGRSGESLFTGNMETDEDRAKIPANVAEKLKRMEEMRTKADKAAAPDSVAPVPPEEK